jgi:predicted RNA binding protein YcfA (HicA-like mRNA interferase family)
MKGFYAQLIQILKANKYYYVRQGKGSHEIWSNGSKTLIVPFNCYSRHTANQVLKDAGINHHF